MCKTLYNKYKIIIKCAEYDAKWTALKCAELSCYMENTGEIIWKFIEKLWVCILSQIYGSEAILSLWVLASLLI